MEYSTLMTGFSEGIFTITINRPDKLNALNKDVIEELSNALDKIYTDEQIRAAIITGSGPKAFVAGADISEFTSLSADQGRLLAEIGQQKVFSKVENCGKPIVAAVNGFALGGGCELAMACHFRLASSNARFGQPEVNLGLIPGYGGTQRLTQLIGKGKAMEMMLSGNMIDAGEARLLGLVNYVVAPDELLPKTIEILKGIISKAPEAISKIISLTNAAGRGEDGGLQKEIDAFGKLFGTKDMKEGVSAFLEKENQYLPDPD